LEDLSDQSALTFCICFHCSSLIFRQEYVCKTRRALLPCWFLCCL